MFKKARAFVALIAFVTTVKCDITIYKRNHEQIAIAFKDELASFGPGISIEGIKVFIYFSYCLMTIPMIDVKLNIVKGLRYKCCS